MSLIVFVEVPNAIELYYTEFMRSQGPLFVFIEDGEFMNPEVSPKFTRFIRGYELDDPTGCTCYGRQTCIAIYQLINLSTCTS